MGIEPTSKAWEAFILPMNYARVRKLFSFLRYFKIIACFGRFGNTEEHNNLKHAQHLEQHHPAKQRDT